jgi:hypothetical protein
MKFDLTPFNTYLEFHPDMDEGDRLVEIDRLFQRQRAIDAND